MYGIVVRQSRTLQSVPLIFPAPTRHRTVITVLLTVFPIPYFTSPGLFCNCPSVLLNPFTFLTQAPNHPPNQFQLLNKYMLYWRFKKIKKAFLPSSLWLAYSPWVSYLVASSGFWEIYAELSFTVSLSISLSLSLSLSLTINFGTRHCGPHGRVETQEPSLLSAW